LGWFTWVIFSGIANDLRTVADGGLVILELILTGRKAVQDVRSITGRLFYVLIFTYCFRV